METVTNEALRPESLAKFIGQEALKERLSPFITESRETRAPMIHTLLTSEPGMGKTTLAEVISYELGDQFTPIDISRMTERQFVTFIRQFEGGILFVDEIHRARPAQQEMLLTLIEEGYISSSHGVEIEIPWLTVIAATTERHKLLPAVVRRFPLRLEYGDYSDDNMTEIVGAMGHGLGIQFEQEQASALGMAAGGVPSPARDLVRAWRALTFENRATVEAALDLVGREPDGLTKMHLEYMQVLSKFESAGERTLCTHLRAHPSELHSLERLLVRRGFITQGQQGRILNGKGQRRLKGDNEERTYRRRDA